MWSMAMPLYTDVWAGKELTCYLHSDLAKASTKGMAFQNHMYVNDIDFCMSKLDKSLHMRANFYSTMFILNLYLYDLITNG